MEIEFYTGNLAFGIWRLGSDLVRLGSEMAGDTAALSNAFDNRLDQGGSQWNKNVASGWSVFGMKNGKTKAGFSHSIRVLIQKKRKEVRDVRVD